MPVLQLLMAPLQRGGQLESQPIDTMSDDSSPKEGAYSGLAQTKLELKQPFFTLPWNCNSYKLAGEGWQASCVCVCMCVCVKVVPHNRLSYIHVCVQERESD